MQTGCSCCPLSQLPAHQHVLMQANSQAGESTDRLATHACAPLRVRILTLTPTPASVRACRIASQPLGLVGLCPPTLSPLGPVLSRPADATTVRPLLLVVFPVKRRLWKQLLNLGAAVGWQTELLQQIFWGEGSLKAVAAQSRQYADPGDIRVLLCQKVVVQVRTCCRLTLLPGWCVGTATFFMELTGCSNKVNRGLQHKQT